MSWSDTYSHNVLIGLDYLGAALLFNRDGITISSMCRVVQLFDMKIDKADQQLAELNLHPWQIVFLRWLAIVLDKIQAGHCAKAVEGDLERAESIKRLLCP